MSIKKKILIATGVTVGVLGVSLGAFFGVCVKGNDYIADYIKGLELNKVSYQTPSFTEDADTGFFSIEKQDDEDFRILQLTDTHIGGGNLSKKNDKKTIDSMLNVINSVRPHLIILTGDVLYPLSLHTGNLNNEITAYAVVNFFESLGIPWTIVFGNHDNSAATTLNRSELADIFANDDLRYCLFNKNPIDENLSGYGNNVINVVNEDGTINNTLFLFDSHSTVSAGKYDKIHDDQVEWYKKTVTDLSVEENGVAEGEKVKSLAFFHIPLEEYKTALELHKAGSGEVKYLYGDADEKILCYETKKNRAKGKLFDAIVGMSSTAATFCGHNHKNNFAIMYKGVQLTFGSSMVYNGLSGIAKNDTYRGGTLITLDNGGNFSSRNILEKNID